MNAYVFVFAQFPEEMHYKKFMLITSINSTEKIFNNSYYCTIVCLDSMIFVSSDFENLIFIKTEAEYFDDEFWICKLYSLIDGEYWYAVYDPVNAEFGLGRCERPLIKYIFEY